MVEVLSAIRREVGKMQKDFWSKNAPQNHVASRVLSLPLYSDSVSYCLN